jgi:hypothetical protein
MTSMPWSHFMVNQHIDNRYPWDYNITAEDVCAEASKDANGTCRDPRRPQGERPAWVRPIGRAHRALNVTVRLIEATLRTIAASERCAYRRPVHASRDLQGASNHMVHAARMLTRAAVELGITNECIARQPELSGPVPALLIQATERWIAVAAWLNEVSAEVNELHADVCEGLETGELVSDPADRRLLIGLTPHEVAARAFLASRQPRLTDRITPLLRRRRRTRRPAALSVPPRTAQGRAPPLFSICAL